MTPFEGIGPSIIPRPSHWKASRRFFIPFLFVLCVKYSVVVAAVVGVVGVVGVSFVGVARKKRLHPRGRSMEFFGARLLVRFGVSLAAARSIRFRRFPSGTQYPLVTHG